MPKPRAPTGAQLCAIARLVLTNAPHMDDGEWREGIKRRLIAQRLAYPRPHVIGEAMTRVERALERKWGPRPAPR